MADPRLQWRNINAPDFTAAVRATAAAGDALDRGFDSAQGLIAKYQEGREAKGDAEVLQEISGFKDEADFDAWLANGGLRGRTISKNMMTNLAGNRGALLGYAKDRASIRNTDSIIADRAGRLGIAQSANDRIQADWEYSNNSRDELARLSQGYVGAVVEGRQGGYGNTVIPGGPQGSAFENYLASTIQSESGGDPTAKNEKSSATGLGQFTTGTWNQLRAKYPELGLTADGRTDPAQSERALRVFTRDNMRFLESAGIPINEGNLYAAHFLGNGGARSVLTASDDTLVSERIGQEALDANPFLKGMTVGEFRRWSAKKGGANAPQGAYANTNRGGVGGEAAASFYDQLGNSQYLSPAQIQGLMDGTFTAQSFGQGQLDDELSRRAAVDQSIVEEAISGYVQDSVANPDNITTEDVLNEIDANPTMTNTEKAKAKAAAAELASVDPRFAPDPSADPDTIAVDEAVSQTIAAMEHSDNVSDDRQRLDRISEFREDPAASLEAALDLADGRNEAGGFGNFISGGSGPYSRQKLDNLITKYATQNGVTREIAAAAMYEAFKDDPFTVLGINANTLDNRFKSGRVKSLVEENFSVEALSGARERSGNVRQSSAALKSAQSGLERLRSKRIKMLKAGSDTAKIDKKIAEAEARVQQEIAKTRQ